MSKHPLPKKTSSEPKKKKRWISILTTNDFDNMEIGETLASLPNEVLGRKIIANLMYLTNDPKKQHINLIFKANEVKGDKVSSDLVGYEISPSYVKRALRKGRIKLDESYLLTTKDNVKIKIKPLYITRFKTQGSALTALRKKSLEFVTSNVQSLTYIELIQSIIANRLQKDLRMGLSKIYPLAICEIRMLERV